MSDAPETESTCRWCDVKIREVVVLTGPSDRIVEKTLWIGVDPDSVGQVICREDGAWRKLAPYQQGRAVVDAYLIHNAHTCNPDEAQAPDGWMSVLRHQDRETRQAELT